MPATKHNSKLPAHLRAARRSILLKGWTQKAVAIRLGLSETHLSLVLNGHRVSASLLRRIAALPENPNSTW